MPTDAVQLGANGEFAFVVGADNKVDGAPGAGRPALPGAGAGRRKGLNPGETVVTQGQYRLTAGTQVVAVRAADQVANSSTATAGMLP